MFNYRKFIVAIGLSVLSQQMIASPDDNVRLIIKYKKPFKTLSATQQNLSQLIHLPVKTIQPIAGGAFVAIIEAQSTQAGKSTNLTASVLAQLRKNSNILYAVKDRIGHIKPLPSVPIQDASIKLSHEIQWDEFKRPEGVMLESAPYKRDGAWAYTTGNANPAIVVAVLDTGIAEHDSLNHNLIRGEEGQIWGWNFAENNQNLNDETASFHGTHVAGTIAGYGDVMIGMGEDLKILPLKIPDASGMFYESYVINAIHWAVGESVPGLPDNPYPAKVLNMSFGVDEQIGKEIDHCDEALQESIYLARKRGAVIIAAAGNDNRWEHFNAPAVCNGVLKVAATSKKGLRSYFSNYGPTTTFAAPGGDQSSGLKQDGILSTVQPGGGYRNSGFDFYQGTSMASPHVAGIAGLVFAASPKPLSAEKVEQILYTTTHAFGLSHDPNKSCTSIKPCGHGIVDAEQAVKATLAQFDVLLTAPQPHPLYPFNTNDWIPIHPLLKNTPQNQLPSVFQDSDGRIIAQVNGHFYRLDQTHYQQCQIIGFDGVGCYR